MVRSLLWMALTIGVFPVCGLSQDRQAHTVSHWNQWRGPLGTGVARMRNHRSNGPATKIFAGKPNFQEEDIVHLC